MMLISRAAVDQRCSVVHNAVNGGPKKQALYRIINKSYSSVDFIRTA